VKLRDRIGISETRQRQLSRAMQVALIGMVFIGFDRGNVGVFVNALVALGVTYVPAILERDYGLPMDTGLTLWITGAVFLHGVGVTGVPGVSENLYRNLWWWDHLTHALSSSIVAAVGYTVVRALEEHSDAVYFPPRFTFVFIMVFVMAFGVFWEVIEFALGGLGTLFGGSVLTQYGLDDTMLDLFFDLIGAVLAALFGTAYLSDLSAHVAERIERVRSGS
jgi:hypothetical protein